MKKIILPGTILFMMITSFACKAQISDTSALINITSAIELPQGFSSVIVADSLGKARHMAVNKQGDVYVKLDKLIDGKSIYWLHDSDADGKADVVTGFGSYTGTGMNIKDGYLYASSNDDIYRYKLNENGEVADTGKAEKIVTGLTNKFMHAAKAFTLDDSGNIYVNIGAYSNACQEKDRTAGSPGQQPCPILEDAAGIWKFRADKLNQSQSDGTRYATGLRNVVGIDWNSDINTLFVMQHGRDQLHTLYPDLYTDQESAELPAECMYALHQGDDCGWPYIYYDQIKNKKMLAPEYGGDGKKTGGENAIDPIVAFPGHMAPNGLLFYTGNMFPEKYKHGAFIAFHGSWNRAPEPQKGFFVAFVPFNDGKPDGDWEIFADGFAGMDVVESPGDAKHRPCGLAQDAAGALYVSDDAAGTIYKITYNQ